MTSLSQRLVVVSLALFVVLAGLPGLAAAETRSEGTVVVPEGETVEGDLEAFGGTVVVHGTVNGDLQAFAGNVDVYGDVTGDVNAFAGNVLVDGSVGGDVKAVGGNVEVTPDAEIAGNLAGAAGNVAIDGVVRGDVEIGADDVALGPTARVDGDFTYDGTLTRADGAVVSGTLARDSDLSVAPAFGVSAPLVPEWAGWAFSVYWFLVGFAAAAVLLAVFPTFSRDLAARAVESPLRSGGVGLLTLVGVPLALVAIAVTIVGIPLSILGVFLYAVTVWVGSLYGRVAVGSWLTSLADVENRWAGLVVGFVTVALATRVPYLGGVVELAVLLLGLGALSLSVYETYRGSRPETVEETVEESGGVRPA